MESNKANNPNHSTSSEKSTSGIAPQKPSSQFALSVAIGVITILALAASYYYGIIRF